MVYCCIFVRGWKYGTGAVHYNAFPLIKAICISLTFYEPKLICCYLREYVLFLWVLWVSSSISAFLWEIQKIYFSVKYFMGISICCLCLCRNASCVSALFLLFTFSIQFGICIYYLLITIYIILIYLFIFCLWHPYFYFLLRNCQFWTKEPLMHQRIGGGIGSESSKD